MFFMNRVFVSSILLVLFFLTANGQEMSPDAGTNGQFEWPSTDHNTLTQNGVTTRLVNDRPETTFSVTASASATYPVDFWLMGVRHSNGTCSKYMLKVDNDSVGEILTDRGDWYSYQHSLYLSEGDHQISLVGTLDDVPNAEHVSKGKTVITFKERLNSDTVRYAQRKNHQALTEEENASFLEDSLSRDYRVINFNFNDDAQIDTIRPSTEYNAELNKQVFYSFFRLEYFHEGQHVSMRTSGTSLSHALNLFSMDDPSVLSRVAVSGQAGEASLSVDIPQSGFYYVLLRTNDPSEFGTCNLCINEEKCFDNVPICSSSTVIQHPFTGLPCCYFAVSKNGDPFICLMGEDDRVNAHNDDYPFDPEKSIYNWGKNARINRPSGQKGWLFTTTKSYPCQRLPKCDIYVECRSAWVDSIQHPFFKLDDAIMSFDPVGFSEDNNCYAWSVGIWNSWMDYNEIGTNQEDFDAFFERNGFHRTNSSESADIDLYGIGNKIKHASVKSKAHQYAAGYDWESKLGHHQRVFHPRDAVRGGSYGEVVAHYMRERNMTYPYPGPGPVLDFSFSESEMTQIDNGIKKIPNNIKDSFWELYNDYQNDSIIATVNETSHFDRARVYNALLNYCIGNPNTSYLLYKEASRRSVFPMKLLHDITISRNPNLLEYVRETCKSICDEREDKPLLNVQAEEILLSKVLLAGTSSRNQVEGLAAGNATSSDDFALSITLLGHVANISFDLTEKSEVQLVLVDLSSFAQKDIIKKQTFEAGMHSVSCRIDQPGLYSIGLMVNGGFYEKKFKVEH